jgi:helicase-like protein
VALKSILAQFQEELWARFTIPLVRLDSVGIQRVQRKIPASMNPFHWFDRCIISIDTLKKDTKYFRYLQDTRWDVVVVDECQNVAERGASSSQRAKLARLLAGTCDSLIFTSATPHDGRPESFASLMNLLEPTAVADPSNYAPEDIRGLFLRRFKKDVLDDLGTSTRERATHQTRVTPTKQEEVALASLRGADFRSIRAARTKRGDAAVAGASTGGSMLFRTTLQKAFLSSPRACLDTIDERSQRLERKSEDKGADEAVDHDLALLAELRAEIAPVDEAGPAKLDVFFDLLREIGVSKKKSAPRLVVFSERIATLELLGEEARERLGLKEAQVALFTGALDDQAQRKIVQDFGTAASKIKILLCSDAAAEGLNLHYFCHHLVHFDIPWSLITLQQRNGRIDRYGQSQTPNIHYLLSYPTDAELKGDARILERLVEREDYAHKNLGDAASLLHLHDVADEEERIARAIEDGEAAENVIPDEPPQEEIDLVALLFGNEAEAATAQATSRQTGDPFRLVPDEISFAREALQEIEVQDAVEWLPDHSGFELRQLPDDLARRYEYLPQELSSRLEEALFTTDRTLVMEALAEARQQENRWPKWQLFWELHPFAEWLSDRVLAAFARHEAPALHVVQGLEPGERVVIIQTFLTNQDGRPVEVPWFGVRFNPGADRPDEVVIDFHDIARATGLVGEKGPTNPDRKIDLSSIQALLPVAVEAARRHVSVLRDARGRELVQKLKEEERRFQRWKKAKQALLDTREAKLAGRGGSARKALDDDRRHFEATVADRRAFLDSLKTADRPYLRVACVLHRGGEAR